MQKYLRCINIIQLVKTFRFHFKTNLFALSVFCNTDAKNSVDTEQTVPEGQSVLSLHWLLKLFKCLGNSSLDKK